MAGAAECSFPFRTRPRDSSKRRQESRDQSSVTRSEGKHVVFDVQNSRGTSAVTRYVFVLVAITCALAMPAARACKPLVPEERVRAFVAVEQPPNAIIFSGKVIAVNQQRQANGIVVTDTVLQPTKWWTGFHSGLIVVRTTSSTGSPCPDLGVLHASVGEQWLILGWVRNSIVESWVELGTGLSLGNGSIPGGMDRELRRAKVAL